MQRTFLKKSSLHSQKTLKRDGINSGLSVRPHSRCRRGGVYPSRTSAREPNAQIRVCRGDKGERYKAFPDGRTRVAGGSILIRGKVALCTCVEFRVKLIPGAEVLIIAIERGATEEG